MIMKNKWGKLNFTHGKINGKIILMGMVLLAIAVFIMIGQDFLRLILDGDIDKIRAAFTGNPVSAFLFMLLVMMIQNSFTVIPLILVITINITLFGVVNGFLWSWFTSVVAAVLVFIGVRFLFKDLLINRFPSRVLEEVQTKGFTYVFQARIFPFVPTSLINILAGLSTVHFRHFFLGTIFGNFLFFIVLSLIPAGILSSTLSEYELGMILFVIITVFIGIRKVYLRKKRSIVNEPLEGSPSKEISK